MRAHRIVVCVTGASGAIYARRILNLLGGVASGRLANPVDRELELHWVASSNAELVWLHELGEALPSDVGKGVRRWHNQDFAAPFASGSNAPDAVIVAPCSMSTLARVAHGGGSDLIARTCEVALKERKTLILLTREMPLSLVHLRNMVAATEAGAIVMPATPAFYSGTQTLEETLDTVIMRVLDHCKVPLPLIHRWGDADDHR